MSNLSLVKLLIFSLCLLGSGQLQAQNPAANSMELEVFHLVSQQKPAKLFFQNPEGEFEPLKFTQKARGRANLIPRANELVLYRSARVDGKEVKQPAMTLKLPSGASRALVFFYLDADDKVQYRSIADSYQSHQGGDVRVLNLTEQDVAILVQDEQIKLKENAEVTRSVMNGDKRFSFAFAVLEPEPFKSPVQTLPIRSEAHRLLIVFTYRKKPVFDSTGNIVSYLLIPDVTRLYDRVPSA